MPIDHVDLRTRVVAFMISKIFGDNSPPLVLPPDHPTLWDT